MKRIFCLMMVFVMLLCLGMSPAAAEGNSITQDAFVFERLADGNLKLTGYTDKNSEDTINIPSITDGLQVDEIGKYAFVDCQAKSITIPNTVTRIEACAFDHCTGIEKISIPNTVLYLNGNPFTGCRNLVNISLDPKHPTLQVTSDGVLYSKRDKTLLCYPCSRTEREFNVKPGTIAIGENAFMDCNLLETITLPDTVTLISEGAFLGCTGLKSINCNGCVKIQSCRICNWMISSPLKKRNMKICLLNWMG